MKLYYLRLALAVLAVVFIVAGLFRGEALSVWQKASQVCLECIGIG
jgi:hypothetical protein